MEKKAEQERSVGHRDQTDTVKRSVLNRRSLLAVTASIVGAMVSRSVTRSAEAAMPMAPDDPTRVPGMPPTAYGQRSAFEQAIRVPRSWWASLTPLQDSHGILTPSALHFERHHNGIQIIDPAHQLLIIHGLFAQPLTLPLDHLTRFPAI